MWDLLKAFASLASAVITIEAMHTQSDTAQVILGRGADCVMTVKGNMPTLYRQLNNLSRRSQALATRKMIKSAEAGRHALDRRVSSGVN